jgi:transcriptional regulator with XRE-family HTH domain
MKKPVEKKRGPIKGIKLDQISRTEFGKRLFEIRRARKISQKELGEKVGLSLRMISYYERDENGPPVVILKRIAAALDISASYLVGESPLKKTVKDEIDPILKKPVEALQKLPKKQRRAAIAMIEALAEKSIL